MMAQRISNAGLELRTLMAGIAAVDQYASVMVNSVSASSAQVKSGGVFLACQGQTTHGLRFIEEALAKGAVAILWEPTLEIDDLLLAKARQLAKAAGVPLIEVAGLAKWSGEIAARMFDHPSRKLEVIGVTGTNGKTSCTHYIAQALTRCRHACALVGTLGIGHVNQLSKGNYTTPDAVSLQAAMAEFVTQGDRYLAMEVSSHGLDQGRLTGVEFAVAVWTNLSRDHLDYHLDMQRYADVKRQLFERFEIRHAVLNADDQYGARLAASLATRRHCLVYGMGERDKLLDEVHALDYVWADRVEYRPEGMTIRIKSTWGDAVVCTKLLGAFNVSNLLACVATLVALQIPFEQAVDSLTALEAVAGRMERFIGSEAAPMVVVDYAHTPDALEQVLQTLRVHCEGRLYCVFGCGGNRDSGKRPLMGAIAERLADHIILTDDNPRNEDGGQIVQQILAGMKSPARVQVQRDRAAAIADAIAAAGAADVVLVAGKGHEEVQLVRGQTLAFSDRIQVKQALAGRSS